MRGLGGLLFHGSRCALFPVEIILGFLVDACDFARSKYSNASNYKNWVKKVANYLDSRKG